MKKKVMTAVLAATLAGVALVGGTLAYFTDTTDVAENVFTVGDVEIRLDETFTQNSKLLPGIDIPKVVDVTNIGTEDAYVRVHLAIPEYLDSGFEDEPEFAAYDNLLHWNFSKASVADGQWNWHATNVNGASLAGWPGNGGDWNMYQAKIGDYVYNVYVATYESPLASGAQTANEAIYKVFLDVDITNAGMDLITENCGTTPRIYVVAEGGQKAGFEDAYTALNTQFGVPGTYVTATGWAPVSNE